MLKRAARSLAVSLGAYERASRAWMWTEPRLTSAVRAVTGKNGRLIRRYLDTAAGVRGLHIGCGANHLPGWLNTELSPRRDEIYLDATRPFPFPAGAFEFVYSEHMIEHVPYAGALHMMRECRRVLRPGGVVRIVTPNLAFLTTLLAAPLPPELDAYVEYSRVQYRIGGTEVNGVHVFNHFMRAWGHQFIYDAASLRALFERAGLASVVETPLDESAHAPLRGLAKADRMPAGFLEMESLTMEGQKPQS
jgi:predicted SAM-dependent methyltransferase